MTSLLSPGTQGHFFTHPMRHIVSDSFLSHRRLRSNSLRSLPPSSQNVGSSFHPPIRLMTTPICGLRWLLASEQETSSRSPLPLDTKMAVAGRRCPSTLMPTPAKRQPSVSRGQTNGGNLRENGGKKEEKEEEVEQQKRPGTGEAFWVDFSTSAVCSGGGKSTTTSPSKGVNHLPILKKSKKKVHRITLL